ncbi:DegT/DnrJ/EryC1/StrS family aminotransferase [Candidatus Woesearchaeota archaeon]|nr:DegT/DnrJ/EryC1/StrS family aminotransferase [Candidatus Woesearchaeota archaeon]
MNNFLNEDITKEMKKGLSIETDPELYDFQSKLEKDIGGKFRNERSIGVSSGYVEKGIGRILQKKYSICVSSGTAALQFTLLALGMGRNDEVITVPNTYIGTLLGISNTSAKPVLADAEEDTMLMDPDKIEDSITNKTKAIVPVHLFGQMCNMNKIMKIAKKHGICVIEDAAHSPLAKFNGKFPGEKSDAAFYSFYPNKILGAITNGGMVNTKRREVFEKIDILRDPLSDNPFLINSHRTPAYLDWIQIIFIKIKLKYLKEWTERRREIANRYYEELSGIPIKLPKTDKKAHHVYCNFVIRSKKRDKLKKFLQKKGIQTAIHYSPPIHLSKTYSYLKNKKGDFPVSEKICSEALSLPINPFLRDDELGYVVKNIKSFFKKTL